MTLQQGYETFDVLPSNHQSIQEDVTAFKLSDIDQQIPASYTKPCIFFPWPTDSPDSEKLVSYLRIGLQNVLTQNPLVGGKLHSIGERISVLRHNHEPIQFHVNHLESTSEFPTYEALAAGGFNPSLFATASGLLFPPNLNLGGFHREEGCPVSAFQASFIRGGLVLTMALHHMCGDATSIDHLFSLWAASTKAAKEGLPMPSWKPSLDRSYFTASHTPSTDEIEGLKKLTKGFKFLTIKPNEVATHTPPPKMPPMSLQMYHFSAESCAKLKALCKPADAGRFVSSYDCIAALSWRCMTRARVPYLKLDVASTATNCAHAVNTRGRLGDKVPKEYFGNGFTMAVTENFVVDQLIGEGSLPKAAQAMRQSILDVTEDSIPAIVNVRKGIEGREMMRWMWAPQNVMGTSWTGMQPFTKYDFGNGLPDSLRLAVGTFDGTFGVLPANKIGGKSDGFDVYISLETGCQERLQADVEFQEYCSVL